MDVGGGASSVPMAYACRPLFCEMNELRREFGGMLHAILLAPSDADRLSIAKEPGRFPRKRLDQQSLSSANRGLAGECQTAGISDKNGTDSRCSRCMCRVPDRRVTILYSSEPAASSR